MFRHRALSSRMTASRVNGPNWPPGAPRPQLAARSSCVNAGICSLLALAIAALSSSALNWLNQADCALSRQYCAARSMLSSELGAGEAPPKQLCEATTASEFYGARRRARLWVEMARVGTARSGGASRLTLHWLFLRVYSHKSGAKESALTDNKSHNCAPTANMQMLAQKPLASPLKLPHLHTHTQLASPRLVAAAAHAQDDDRLRAARGAQTGLAARTQSSRQRQRQPDAGRETPTICTCRSAPGEIVPSAGMMFFRWREIESRIRAARWISGARAFVLMV